MPTLGAKDAPKMGHPDYFKRLDVGHPPFLDNPPKQQKTDSIESVFCV